MSKTFKPSVWRFTFLLEFFLLIRPRLTDYHKIYVRQNELDFAIPFLEEDIPLYVDPFLMWKSPSFQDKGIHQLIVSAFNSLGQLVRSGDKAKAIEILVACSECEEVGLGVSATRLGKRIGKAKAEEILSLFERVPYYQQNGFRHFEEIQFFIDGISKDRVSDIACNFMKSFLIDFTFQEAKDLNVPTQEVIIQNVYDPQSQKLIEIKTQAPCHPTSGKPLLLVPKRWLRHTPWLSFDNYFKNHCPQDDIAHEGEKLTRVKVLNYNRDNYGVIDAYIKERERTFEDCKNDPLFEQIPIVSAKRKFTALKKLPTGKEGGADIKYEKLIGELFASLLYPHLDFAKMQARTESGVSIRDLIFYNNRSLPFLGELMDDYGSRQITMEMKNVRQINREHVDQLNRYLSDDLGKFGIFVTRNPLKKAEFKRSVDLWSGQRKAIICLTDQDVEQMVEVFASKQRSPIEVINKKYVEYRRACP